MPKVKKVKKTDKIKINETESEPKMQEIIHEIVQITKETSEANLKTDLEENKAILDVIQEIPLLLDTMEAYNTAQTKRQEDFESFKDYFKNILNEQTDLAKEIQNAITSLENLKNDIKKQPNKDSEMSKKLHLDMKREMCKLEKVLDAYLQKEEKEAFMMHMQRMKNIFG